MSKESKKQSGFSLLELIIAIAILVILTGLLAPQFMKYIEEARKVKIMQKLDTICSVLQTAYVDSTVAGINTATNEVVILSGKVNTAGGKVNLRDEAILKSMVESVGQEEMDHVSVFVGGTLFGEGKPVGDIYNFTGVLILYYPTDSYSDYYYYNKQGGQVGELYKGYYGVINGGVTTQWK